MGDFMRRFFTVEQLDRAAERKLLYTNSPPLPARPWRICGAVTIWGDGTDEAPGQIRGLWKMEPEHPIFKQHFPGRPVFPGLFLLDQLHQLTGWFGAAHGICGEGSATKSGDARFRAPVTPTSGWVEFVVSITKYRVTKMRAVIEAEGEVRISDDINDEGQLNDPKIALSVTGVQVMLAREEPILLPDPSENPDDVPAC